MKAKFHRGHGNQEGNQARGRILWNPWKAKKLVGERGCCPSRPQVVPEGQIAFAAMLSFSIEID